MTQMSLGPSPALRGAPPAPELPYRPKLQMEPPPAQVQSLMASPLALKPAPTRNWVLWITALVAAAALVAVGYLGALLQFGAQRRAEPAPRLVTSISGAASVPPKSEATPAASVPIPAASAPESEAAPPRVESVSPARAVPPLHARARASKAGSTNSASRAKLAAHETSSAEPAPAPEPGPQESPVLAIRPMAASASAPADTASPAEEPTQEGSAAPGTRPNREDVQRTLAALRPQLVECAAGRHGSVDATVTIGANGRITYSLIGGNFVGTPEGSCMARALRAARFPAFSGPNFKVLFPYSL